MTVEEYVKSKNFYTINIAVLEGFGEIYIELEDLLKEYARIKCKEQREICANSAIIGYEKLEHHPSAWNEYIDKASILNAPEPEM